MLGQIVSWGMIAYALGKLAGGGLADYLGGRFNFLGGMLGSIVFTVLFALGGTVPVFTLAWVGQPAVPVVRLAGHGEDLLTMVSVLGLRDGHGGVEPELPVRRRRHAGLHRRPVRRRAWTGARSFT